MVVAAVGTENGGVEEVPGGVAVEGVGVPCRWRFGLKSSTRCTLGGS